MSGATRAKQAERVADMLSAFRSGDRTLSDIEDLTGMHPDYARRWIKALHAVGILQNGEPRKPARGKAAGTWRMS
jgi:DNA-binding IclR family transcriptional regulator